METCTYFLHLICKILLTSDVNFGNLYLLHLYLYAIFPQDTCEDAVLPLFKDLVTYGEKYRGVVCKMRAMKRAYVYAKYVDQLQS